MGVTNDFLVLSAIRGGGPLLEKLRAWQNDPVMQRIQPRGKPLLYGDEDFEMGDSTTHTITAGGLLYGLGVHFAPQAAPPAFGDPNRHYPHNDPPGLLPPPRHGPKPRPRLP